MTGEPYRPDTASLIAAPGGMPQVYRAQVYSPSGAFAPIQLDELGGSVSWSEDRAPRVQADLSAALPASSVVTAIDPRAGHRLRIDAGYIRPDGREDVWPWVDLGLRTSTTARPGAVIRFSAASDEARVIDASPTAATSVSAPDDAAAIRDLIGACISPAPIIDTWAYPSGPVSLADVTDRWSTIRDRADHSGLAVYDAGLGRWVIEYRPASPGTSQHVLVSGPGGTVENADTTVSRDGWANYVTFTYRWRDAAGNDQTIVSTSYVDSGAYSVTGPAGRVVYREDRDTPVSQADANAATAQVLARMLSRGRVTSVKAISALWLRPGMTVSTTVQDAPTERGLVSSVTFDIATGSMELTTRDPVVSAWTVATTTLPPAIPGNPSPPPLADALPPAKALRQNAWVASATATYKGDGTKRADGLLVQGYENATYGNQSALAIFAAANSSGDGLPSRTIASVLAGRSAADIVRVEVQVTATGWFYPAPTGGTLRVSSTTSAAIPGTFTASGGRDKPGWQAGETRWVDISDQVNKAQLIAGNFGVAFGPGNGTDQQFFGTISAPALSVRVTYVA